MYVNRVGNPCIYRYVPICTPAFTPTNCGREEEEGNTHAKSSACMHRLQQLHDERRHPFLFHVAQKSLWEQAKKAGQIYFPPTYEVRVRIRVTVTVRIRFRQTKLKKLCSA